MVRNMLSIYDSQHCTDFCRVWKECEYGGYRRLADLTISILGVGAIGENGTLIS